MCRVPFFSQTSYYEIKKTNKQKNTHLTTVSSSRVEVWERTQRHRAVPEAQKMRDLGFLPSARREAAPRRGSQGLLPRGCGSCWAPPAVAMDVPLNLYSAFALEAGVQSKLRLPATPHPDVASLRAQESSNL